MVYDIIILVESVAREFDVACILKNKIEANTSLNVAVESSTYCRQEVIRVHQSPKLLIVPSLYGAHFCGVTEFLFAWRPKRILSLNYEQIFRKFEASSRAPKDEFSRSFVYQCAWGEFFSNFLIQNGTKASHVFLTGNPVFNLYNFPFRSYYPSRELLAVKYQLDLDKKWLFFPENYFAAFQSEGKTRKLEKRGQNRDELKSASAYAKESLNTVIEWLYELSSIPGLEIIIRPKINVPERAYHLLFKDKYGSVPDSIKIIKEGTCREWVLACSHVVSSYSTVLIEAAYCGKIQAMFEPKDPPKEVFADWHDFGTKIKSFEDLQLLVFRELDDTVTDSLQEWSNRSMSNCPHAIEAIYDTILNCVNKEVDEAEVLEYYRNAFEGKAYESVKSNRLGLIKQRVERLLSWIFDTSILIKKKKYYLYYFEKTMVVSGKHFSYISRKMIKKISKQWDRLN